MALAYASAARKENGPSLVVTLLTQQSLSVSVLPLDTSGNGDSVVRYVRDEVLVNQQRTKVVCDLGWHLKTE